MFTDVLNRLCTKDVGLPVAFALPPMQPAIGRLMLSSPFIPDANFARGVVLLVEHGSQGSVGFSLNRPLGISPENLLDGFPPYHDVAYNGGPVQPDTLHYVHTLGRKVPGAVRLGNKPGGLSNNLYWGGDFDCLQKLLRRGDASSENVRFFVGYSGWSPGQLEQEMADNTWIAIDAALTHVWHPGPAATLWTDILKEQGPAGRLLSHFPAQPELN